MTMALPGLTSSLTRPDLFKKGGIIGIQEEEEPKGPSVDPEKVFDEAKTAGAGLADTIQIDFAPEASEGLPAMVRDLLDKMAKATEGQGARTKLAAALVMVDGAAPKLTKFFASTKGQAADGQEAPEGDDHTVEAASILLARRIKPGLSLKPADMAVAMLRAVFAVRESV